MVPSNISTHKSEKNCNNSVDIILKIRSMQFGSFPIAVKQDRKEEEKLVKGKPPLVETNPQPLGEVAGIFLRRTLFTGSNLRKGK
uniref:Uncharacterized protein n=1 Tax=Arundo donax TaxID=35708 RepID=A0A0A9E7T7_ARUDO